MAEWHNYVNSSTEFIERARPTLVRAFQAQAFPTVTTKYREQNIPLAQSLRDANHRIVLRLLPNISDEEAKAIFGPTYTAEDVHRTPPLELFI